MLSFKHEILQKINKYCVEKSFNKCDGFHFQFCWMDKTVTKMALTNEYYDVTRANERSNKRIRNNVYICGFLPNRLHNKQLTAIVQDLMQNFFVCSNPIVSHQWNKQTTHELLANAGAMIFLLNKFTLNDPYCMTTLRFAYISEVPVIMLRHPSMKLVVNVEIANKNQFNESATMLRNAICESYKSSIEYDKSRHQMALQKLTNTLHAIFDEENNSTLSSRMSSAFDDYITPAANGDRLKLPTISTPPVSPLNSSRRSVQDKEATSNNAKIRSRSIGNIKNYSNERSTSAPIRRLSMRPPMKVEEVQEQAPAKRTTFRERQLSSRQLTDDPSLYNETQYLVFHCNDKSQKPRLIHFPSDIIIKDCDDDESSIWGSDSSLEVEVERASRVQGNLEVKTPPGTPVRPYNDPI